ncbi:hypothetical protein B6U91_00865 [Candidatus Pacearchaeota archaeon ex4484_71]|nr:MAG: hypothetical protein B6U91_00865 [Candidatus Pacearchaeota archaeon ex4484_71]
MEDLKFEQVEKVSKSIFRTRDLTKISRLESISPPSVFVGSRLKYPQVNVGILSPLAKEEDAEIYDDSKYWAKNNFSISEVVRLRSNLLNSRFKSNVSDVRKNEKFVQISKEIAIASRPVEVEIELKNRIMGAQKKDKVFAAHGMKATLKNARVVSNIKVAPKVDRVIDDDIKASEGIIYLYNNSLDEYALSKILSVGVLGLKKDKRMVPTRWSITATDDMIGKELLKKVRRYPPVNDYEVFFGEFMGNQYLIMFFPGVWEYELFELYYPGSSWNNSNEMKASTDYEGYEGRKSYAKDTAGGYYATRLPILELLNSMKRQARVLVIRLETPSYWASLGVWVVRESVRKALGGNGMKFGEMREFLESIEKIGRIKYNFNPEVIFNKSRLIKGINEQRRLREWF